MGANDDLGAALSGRRFQLLMLGDTGCSVGVEVGSTDIVHVWTRDPRRQFIVDAGTGTVTERFDTEPAEPDPLDLARRRLGLAATRVRTENAVGDLTAAIAHILDHLEAR